MEDRQDLEVGLFWNGFYGVPLRSNRKGSSILSRFDSMIYDRKRIHLGASVALDSVAMAAIRYRNGRPLNIIPSWGHHKDVASALRRLCKSQLVSSDGIEIVLPNQLARLSKERRMVLLDSRQITPEVISYRTSRLRRSIPVVMSHHTISYREQLVSTFLPLILSPSCPWDCIVSPSHAAQQAVEGLMQMLTERLGIPGLSFQGQQAVIPYGVDTDTFRPRNRHLSRQMFRISDDAFVFLVLGRISAVDKADLLPLLLAFLEVKARNPESLLIIAGNSRDKAKEILLEEASERNLLDGVRFLDSVTDSEKVYLYGAADVFVSVSDNLQESYGVAVVEAMASGVPQIVSDWNGYKDLVVQNETGFRVSSVWAPCDEEIALEGFDFPKEFPLDHFKLAQTVAIDMREFVEISDKLIKNKDLRLRLARQSRQRAIREYSFSMMMARFHELFDDLTSRSSMSLSEDHQGRKNISAPEYHRCFSHYPTYNLGEEHLLRLNVSATIGRMPTYKSLFDELCWDSGWDLDALIGLFGRGPLPVHEILARRSLNDSADSVKRQIMWLVKYGLLSVIKPET